MRIPDRIREAFRIRKSILFFGFFAIGATCGILYGDWAATRYYRDYIKKWEAEYNQQIANQHELIWHFSESEHWWKYLLEVGWTEEEIELGKAARVSRDLGL